MWHFSVHQGMPDMLHKGLHLGVATGGCQRLQAHVQHISQRRGGSRHSCCPTLERLELRRRSAHQAVHVLGSLCRLCMQARVRWVGTQHILRTGLRAAAEGGVSVLLSSWVLFSQSGC
jgi:hypothetical protein